MAMKPLMSLLATVTAMVKQIPQIVTMTAMTAANTLSIPHFVQAANATMKVS